MLSVQLVSPIKGDFQVGGIELIYNTTLVSWWHRVDLQHYTCKLVV